MTLKKIKNKKKVNQLRIIGGQWRGRKLSFADGEGLRPTLDRVRETLFNWLQNDIAGANCLDLFTGSGALGFEALSRNADNVVMIDKNPYAIQMIKSNLTLLNTHKAQILQMDAENYLNSFNGDKLSQTFDIVFLDPPFNKQLISLFCGLLEQSNCLSDKASIYIELEKNTSLPNLPKHWTVAKEKKAGQLSYYLIQVNQHSLHS
ncbi:MAG: 16S rRNA (guanine(966)-N(2))-methyltransferase RsmD [Gammaproteobacteria bacterium]|nr:16S rRNA (guanine(966)-N(2))-methyltransferase RsmD [Gammaproteobacteria bacterium]